MQHLQLIVEDESTEIVLRHVLPLLLPEAVTFDFLRCNGKQHLLNNLAAYLQGYRAWMPSDYGGLVLVDEDRQDCHHLKARLEEAAQMVGLVSKSRARPSFQVVNRIVVEELEAWLLGDAEAVHAAYPRVPLTFIEQEKYRDPDAITGGTAEALAFLLNTYGYRMEGLPKLTVARTIAPHMQPSRNRSHSFQVFVAGLRALVESGG